MTNPNVFSGTPLRGKDIALSMRLINTLEMVPRFDRHFGSFEEETLEPDIQAGTNSRPAFAGIIWATTQEHGSNYRIYMIQTPWVDRSHAMDSWRYPAVKLYGANGSHMADFMKSQGRLHSSEGNEYNYLNQVLTSRSGPSILAGWAENAVRFRLAVIERSSDWRKTGAIYTNQYITDPFATSIANATDLGGGSESFGRTTGYFMEGSDTYRMYHNYHPHPEYSTYVPSGERVFTYATTQQTAGFWWEDIEGELKPWQWADPAPTKTFYMFGTPSTYSEEVSVTGYVHQQIRRHPTSYYGILIGNNNYVPLDGNPLFSFDGNLFPEFELFHSFCFNGLIYVAMRHDSYGYLIAVLNASGATVETIQYSDFTASMNIGWLNVTASGTKLNPNLFVVVDGRNGIYQFEMDGTYVRTWPLLTQQSYLDAPQCIVLTHSYGTPKAWRHNGRRGGGQLSWNNKVPAHVMFSPDYYRAVEDSIFVTGLCLTAIKKEDVEDLDNYGEPYYANRWNYLTIDGMFGRTSSRICFPHAMRYILPRFTPEEWTDAHIPRVTRWTRYERPTPVDIGLFPADADVEGSGVYLEYLTDIRSALLNIMVQYKRHDLFWKEDLIDPDDPLSLLPWHPWNWEQNSSAEEELDRLVYLWNLYYNAVPREDYGCYSDSLTFERANGSLGMSPIYDIDIGEVAECLNKLLQYTFS